MNMSISELMRLTTGFVLTVPSANVPRLPGSTSVIGNLFRYALGCGLCSLGFSMLAVSPAEVQQQLSAGETITLVDLRPTPQFKEGHIPNAINIPAALIPDKQLPPLGRVVVYDTGLGRDLAPAAAAALNQKPGIKAEVLAGGFAAWKMALPATTQSGGMTTEALPQIIYQELKRKSADEVVLVDLRKPPSPSPGVAGRPSAIPPLISLATEFPGARITHSPWNLPEARQAQADSTPPLLVLIDNDDGKARETARALKASGHTRFVILAGGETILERKGAPGLQRAGATLTVQPPPATAAAPPKP